MTLFHVIKYPLSNPPTPDEILDLPDAIFNGRNEIELGQGVQKHRELMIKYLLAYEDPSDTLPRP